MLNGFFCEKTNENTARWYAVFLSWACLVPVRCHSMISDLELRVLILKPHVLAVLTSLICSIINIRRKFNEKRKSNSIRYYFSLLNWVRNAFGWGWEWAFGVTSCLNPNLLLCAKNVNINSLMHYKNQSFINDSLF